MRIHKYHAQRTEIDGIRFDSRAEAERWQELREMEAAGEIKALIRQETFPLIPAFKKNGKTYRGITYRADFGYIDKNGRRVVEDVKGYRTKEYLLKKKLFEYMYPDLTIVEVIK